MLDVRCCDATKLLLDLGPNTANAIIVDPPYGSAYQRGSLQPVFEAALNSLVEGGALYVFTRWDVAPFLLSSIPLGLELKNQIIWVKDGFTAGDLGGNFAGQYEVLFFLTKGRHLRRGRRWSNVWTFPRVPSKKLRTPTEKPVDLFARIVEASTSAGDLIVDPFCGSGTTGEAARQFKDIRVLLGDLDPKMVRIACERLRLHPPAGVPMTFDGRMTLDPVYQVEPPEPHLWGLHPEDLARFFRRNEPETGPPVEEGTLDVLTAIEAIDRLKPEGGDAVSEEDTDTG